MVGGTDDERVTVETPVAFEGHLIEPPSQVVETSKREIIDMFTQAYICLLYTSPSPRDRG